MTGGLFAGPKILKKSSQRSGSPLGAAGTISQQGLNQLFIGLQKIFRKMTGCPMPGVNFPEGWIFFETALFCCRATRIEIAAHWRVGGAGDIALQQDALALLLNVRIAQRYG